jgi:DNA-binding CsgD family transcriptional regulator
VAGQLTQERARDVERIEGHTAVFAEVEHQFDLRPRRVWGIQRKVWEDAELEQMQPGEIARLQTGMESRVIVPSATVDSPTAVRLARELASLGEQARVMPDPPMSLMLFDERVALVPIDPSDPARGALALRNRSLVLAMRTLFELAWAQARPLIPLEGEDSTSGRDGELLALLVHGLQDEAIGRHLGLSVRTVRRDIARLHVELGARSRFELGVLASRRGWV